MSLSYLLFFYRNINNADHFKDEIIPLIKANDKLKFAQNVELNDERDKGDQLYQPSYKVLKEESG